MNTRVVEVGGGGGEDKLPWIEGLADEMFQDVSLFFFYIYHARSLPWVRSWWFFVVCGRILRWNKWWAIEAGASGIIIASSGYEEH